METLYVFVWFQDAGKKYHSKTKKFEIVH